MVTALQTVVWLFAALLVLARAGFALLPLPEAVPRAGTWVLVGLLGRGTLMNFASPSPWERLGWGPFTLVMFILGMSWPGAASQPAERFRPSTGWATDARLYEHAASEPTLPVRWTDQRR
jgi:hypothetical protein